jgi:glyoxylase-like metal-dependent hydrolase (beta-lactamase superfamily II)
MWRGNHEVKEKTGAKVMLHEKDLPLYDNLKMQAQFIGMATPVRAEVDEHIHQGDVIAFGGKGDSVEVLHTPGHTPGSCSFFVASQNLLFQATLCSRVRSVAPTCGEATSIPRSARSGNDCFLFPTARG